MAGNQQAKSTFGWVSMDSTGQSISPAYTFESETSLGFYRSAASHIAVPSTGTLVSRISAIGAVQSAGANFTQGSTSLGTSTFSGTVTVAASGYTGTALQAFSFVSAEMPIMVVQGSASSFTILVWPAARLGDGFITTCYDRVAGVSSLSSGIILHSHCTQNGQIEVRLSNVSTLAATMSAKSLYVYRFSAF